MMKRDRNNFFLFLSIPYNCFQYLAMACSVSSLEGSGSVWKVYAEKQQNKFILQHGNVIYGCSSICTCTYNPSIYYPPKLSCDFQLNLNE